MMLEEGISRLAIHSLIGSSEKEKEYAVKLLLLFSRDEAYCTKIASEKGALVLLSSMAGNLEHPGLSNLAEEVLKQMERVEDNVHHLAEAGRFEPLLSRLCEGMFYVISYPELGVRLIRSDGFALQQFGDSFHSDMNYHVSLLPRQNG